MKALEYNYTGVVDNHVGRRDVILMIFFLAISGNPFFNQWQWIYLVSSLLLFLGFRHRYPFSFNNKFYIVLALYLLIFFLQYLILPIKSIPADINFVLKLVIAFIYTQFMGNNFKSVYFKAITIICTISLIFFFVEVTFGHLPFGIEFGRNKSIIVYNTTIDQAGGYITNDGFFWEKGAFQGYINLAFLFFIEELELLFKKHRKSCIILALTLLTTFSTTGYLVFAFILFASYSLRTGNKFVSLIMSLFVAFVFYYSFTSIDFLGEKIFSQLDAAKDMGDFSIDTQGTMVSRFGSIMVDIEQIKRHPIIGNGFDMDSRYGIYSELMGGSGGGLFGVINMIGIFGIFVYYYFTYKQLLNERLYVRIVVITTLTMLMLGEFFLNFPFFWLFLFLNPLSKSNNSSFN